MGGVRVGAQRDERATPTESCEMYDKRCLVYSAIGRRYLLRENFTGPPTRQAIAGQAYSCDSGSAVAFAAATTARGATP